MLLTILQFQSFNAQVSWHVDLTTNDSAPLANCTCMTLTFELQQAWLFNEPMTGITLDLFLLDEKYMLCNNPGFVQGTDINVPNVGLCDRFTLTNVSIPSGNDGGKTTVTVAVQVVGYISALDPSIAFTATFGTNVITDVEPTVIPNYQVINVGVDATSTNYLSVVADGGTGHLALPPGGTGQDVLIQGTLIVDEDYDFTGLSDIYMGPGAKIVIQNGAMFRLFDKTHVRGCESPWDGIFVKDGILWTDGSTDQSTPDMVIIEDAYTAVTAESGSGVGSGSVIAKETIFRNNGRGIHLLNNPILGWDHVDLDADKNIFEITPASQLSGFAGIQVNNLYYPLYLQDNYYRNLPFGIYSTNTTLVVNKDKFEDISDSGIFVENDKVTNRSLMQTGLGLNENNPTFLNCYTGIRAVNTNITVKQNVMEKVERGVSLRGGTFKRVAVNENIIKANKFGVSVNQWVTLPRFSVDDNEIYVDGEQTEGSAIFTELLHGTLLGRTTFSDNYIELKDARYGIWINSSDRTVANRNDISLKNTRPYDGIRLAGSFTNNFFCNLVTGADIVNEQAGITLDQSSMNVLSCNTTDDVRRGIWAIGSCNPATFRGNTFNTHFYGLQTGAPGLSGVTGVQSHLGNRWLETYSSGAAGAAHFGSTGEVLFSQLLVDPSDGSDLTSNEYTSSGASYFVPQSGNTYVCNSEPAGCPPATEGFAGGISETDKAIAKGILTPGVFADAQKWTSKRQLYRRLLSDTSLVQQGTSIDTFFQAEASTTVGLFEQLHKDMAEMFELAPATDGEMSENLDSINARLTSLLDVETQLDSNPTQQEKAALETQRQTLRQDLADFQDAQAVLDSTQNATRIQTAGQLLTDNAAIQASAVYELNQQSVNEVILDNIIAERNELTQSQVAIIRPIANQCPYAGGDAVFQARALLADGRVYDDATLCNTGGQALIKPEKDAALVFSTRPNPSSGYVVVELEKAAEESGEVILSNALGVQLMMQKYQAGDQAIYLFLDEVPGGTYYLTVRNSTYSSTRIISNLK